VPRKQAAVVEEVKKRGGDAAYGAGDVSSEDDVARLYDEASAFLGTTAPDLVVANAGVGRFGALEGVSTADFDLSFATNVRGVFMWLRAVYGALVSTVLCRSSAVGSHTCCGLKPAHVQHV